LNGLRIAGAPDFQLFLIWGAVVAVYFIFQEDFVNTSAFFYVDLLAFLLVFSTAYRCFRFLFEKSSITITPFFSSSWVFLLGGVVFLYTCYNVYLIVLEEGVQTAMQFRQSTSGEESRSVGVAFSFPILMAGYYLSVKASAMYLKVLFFILSFLVAVVSTSKLFVLIWFFYIVMLRENRISYARLIALSIIFLIFFALSHVVLGKYSSDPGQGLTLALFNTLKVYALSGVGALQLIYEAGSSLDENSMYIGLRLFFPEMIEYPRSQILPWVKVGVWNTNVYTAIGYWYSAMGSLYPYVVGPVLGVWYAVFVNSSRFAKRYLTFYSHFLMFCLFFSVFGDLYLVALPMHINFLIVSIIVGGVRECDEKVHLDSSGL